MNVVIFSDSLPNIVKFTPHFQSKRVKRFWTIESDRRHLVGADFIKDCVVVHVLISFHSVYVESTSDLTAFPLWLAFLKEGARPLLGIFRANHSRSEEHTSELQSRPHLVCRLLLEKKKKKKS